MGGSDVNEDHSPAASRVETRRLWDAAATLDGADRALLNMWMNRGLDDVALARMTGLDEAAVAARRVRIVAHLSDTLGLPPETVRGALDEITAPAKVATPSGNGSPPPEPAAPEPAAPEAAAPEAVAPEATPSKPAAEPAAPDADTPEPGDSTSRRRRWPWGLLAVVVVVVVVVVIVSLGSGGAGHSSRAARTAATTTAPSPAATTPSGSSGDPLVVLAGGPAHAAGSVTMTGTQPHLSLNLSISNLPAASHGHYEIWLYDSIIYARDLGRLPTGVSHLVLPLPSNANRFRWIDISFQPTGVVFHSGESLLRAPNPAFRKAGAR